MGIQAVDNVDLIRHAYVIPAARAAGWAAPSSSTSARSVVDACSWDVGGRRVGGPLLHPPRFSLVPRRETAALLRRYWRSRSGRSRRRWCWRVRRTAKPEATRHTSPQRGWRASRMRQSTMLKRSAKHGPAAVVLPVVNFQRGVAAGGNDVGRRQG